MIDDDLAHAPNVASADLIPAFTIYIFGMVWWLWFLNQPLKNDGGIVMVVLTIVFYAAFVRALVKSNKKLFTLVITVPMSVSISTIVVGVLSYTIAEALNVY